MADPPSLGRMLLLAAALFSLILPIIGPLDDHHFAERAHSHDHIFLNGKPAPHGHAYENRRGHLHSAAMRVTYDAGEFRIHSVVYLAPATASLLLAVMSAPYHTAPDALRLPTPKSESANPLRRFVAATRSRDGADVPPPLPPPIA